MSTYYIALLNQVHRTQQHIIIRDTDDNHACDAAWSAAIRGLGLIPLQHEVISASNRSEDIFAAVTCYTRENVRLSDRLLKPSTRRPTITAFPALTKNNR